MTPVAYKAPLRELEFVLHEVLEVTRALHAWQPSTSVDRNAVTSLTQELAEFAEQTVAPLHADAEARGCIWQDGKVFAPVGFREAYQSFCERGWAGLSASPEHGGRGLPAVIANVSTEIFGSASHAWLMYSSMSRGAYECIRANGTAHQAERYLPMLASGRWTGSMCITEADAGTDVGLLQTRAVPMPDGSWRLDGLKRMATNAEHDLAENIVHLVLARIEGAAPGSKGLSLFIAPKFLTGRDQPDQRNSVRCEGIEDKMGIRGTPTCQMRFEGAVAELLGQPNQGLAAMFVMMNIARLGTGMQGVNQGERALQLARDYARHRRQGKALSPTARAAGPDRLIEHAEVRRMLLTQKAWVESGRAFAYWIALQVDRSTMDPEPDGRFQASQLVALLTPVLKAFVTDRGYDCAVLGQQVLGGVGYLRESGASLFVADARVGQIYEGANGIQAIDLLGRKVVADRGERLDILLSLVRATCAAADAHGDLRAMAAATRDLTQAIQHESDVLIRRCSEDPELVGACAYAYLGLVGHLVHAWMWLRMAQVTTHSTTEPELLRAKRATAQFYFDHLYPEVHHLMSVIKAPSRSVMELPAADF